MYLNPIILTQWNVLSHPETVPNYCEQAHLDYMCSHQPLVVLTGISLSLKASLIIVIAPFSRSRIGLKASQPEVALLHYVQSLVSFVYVCLRSFGLSKDHHSLRIHSLNVLDIVCYIQEAYRSFTQTYFMLGHAKRCVRLVCLRLKESSSEFSLKASPKH